MIYTCLSRPKCIGRYYVLLYHAPLMRFRLFVAVEIQETSLQNDDLGREAAEELAHQGQPATVPGIREQRPSREDNENVLEGPRSEFPLPRLGW